MRNTKAQNYDCARCPGYCCSIYRVVDVAAADVRRLASHFKTTVAEVRRRYLKRDAEEDGRPWVLRQKVDPLLTGNHCCTFLNTETRRCMVYDARPEICRDYPYAERCGYWDMLAFERQHQDEPETIVLVQLQR